MVWTDRLELLSWGFPKTPLHRDRIARPLPGGDPPFGSRTPTSSSFRPCRSSRLRRLPPRDPRRSVAPCTRSWGSARFRPVSSARLVASPHRCLRARIAPRTGWCRSAAQRATDGRPSPVPRFTPSRAFPSPQAVPRHRGPCPHAVLLDARRSGRSRPQGLAPTTSPLSRSSVAAGSDPLLSWASFPSRVLPGRPASLQNDLAHRRGRGPGLLPLARRSGRRRVTSTA
jgi:hypothetical protein